eukprot:9469881-Pyramimonas_sp.AAC.2
MLMRIYRPPRLYPPPNPLSLSPLIIPPLHPPGPHPFPSDEAAGDFRPASAPRVQYQSPL